MSTPEPLLSRDPRPPTWVRWRILGLLFGLAFVAYVLRISLSILAEPAMPELGISELEMGWVFAAFTFGYALFQLPGGLFGEWAGPRRALAWAAVVWTLVTLASGGVPILLRSAGLAVAALVVLRFVLGAAQAPLFPIQAGAVAQWFPVARWGLPNSLVSSGLGLGAAATPPVVAWLMVRFGWRETLYLTAPLGVVAAAVWWWYSRDAPEQHAGVNAAELALIRGDAGARGQEASVAEARGPAETTLELVRRLLRNREVVLLSISYLSMNYVFYIFFNWFFLYLVEVRGFGILASGFLASLPWLVGAFAAGIGGETCDRLCRCLGPRWGCRLPSVVALPLMGGLLIAGAMADDPYWAVGLLSVSFSLSQFVEGSYWAGLTFVAGRHTAAAGGVLNTGGNLGGVLSGPLIPIFVGWLGWLGALSTGAVFALLAAVLWLFIRVDRPLEDAAGRVR